MAHRGATLAHGSSRCRVYRCRSILNYERSSPRRVSRSESHVSAPMWSTSSSRCCLARRIAWGQRLGVPVISSYHTNLAAYCHYFRLGALAPTMWAYRRFLHNQCVTTLCPSPSTARELRRQGFTRVGLWPRGVDATLFSPERRSQSWRAEIAGDPSQPIVLYAGRLSHEKNLNTLAQAWRGRTRKDAHLVLVGDGPARADLERSLAGQSVTFTGYLRGEDLARAYASADLFAFPSLTETFGQVAQEAMASGLPVLGFDADGVRDLVRPAETGLLAPRGDGAAFTRLLNQLLASPQKRAQLGAQARTLAASRSWESIMDGLLANYTQ